MNKHAPFVPKQREYLLRSLSSWFNVAEGGKRGGKNVLETFAWCIELETHPDKFHLAAGVDQSSARINIIECDGYGVRNFFSYRCRIGKFEKKDCLYIQTKVGQKIIFFAGGKRDGDEAYIKGYTFGSAYVTEANECHPNFIQEVFDRTLSSKRRKLYHDFNPKGENHWYYRDVLDFHEKQQSENPDYGYNYGHFTISDNMSISDEELNKHLSTYDKNTIWYQRDILGRRKRAEGLIYRSFADKPQDFFIPAVPRLMEINAAMDFGGTKSQHALVATGITPGYKKLIALRSERHKAEGTKPSDIDRIAVEFVGNIIREYGRCDYFYWDNEASVLGNGIYEAIGKAFPQVTVQPCYKARINDRIALVSRLMGLGMFGWTKDCQTLKEALEEAVWDDKHDDERLDDGSTDIDTLDAFEYTICRNMDRFIY